MNEWEEPVEFGDEFRCMSTGLGMWVQNKKTGNMTFYPAPKNEFGEVVIDIKMEPINARNRATDSQKENAEN